MTHADDHNALHAAVGAGLPTSLTPSSTGHLSHHATIAGILTELGLDANPTEGEGGHGADTAALAAWLAGAVFGPLLGAQAVRDGTTPLAVTHPGGNPTVVNPGDNIASKITTAGVGGTLWFTKGTYNLSAILDPLADQTWVLESAAGFDRTASDSVVFDGGDQAFDFLVRLNAGGITLRGGVFQNCGNVSSNTFSSAIQVAGGNAAGGNLVEDVVAKDNYNKGIGTQSPNNTIRRCYMTNNGRYDITCFNTSGQTHTGNVIENCRWSFGNSRLLNPGDDAGGSKFANNPGIIIRECWVHDNYGFGIWPDFALAGGVEGAQGLSNVVEDNRRSGIFWEGTNGGLLSHNYLLNNGWDGNAVGGQSASFENCVQIRITNADSSLSAVGRGRVEWNLVDFDLTQNSSLGGALLLWQHDGHPEQCREWDVENNQFWFRSAVTQRIGGRDSFTPDDIWDNDIWFDHNDYRVVDLTTDFWKWNSSGDGVAQDYSAWQGTFAQDLSSVRTLI